MAFGRNVCVKRQIWVSEVHFGKVRGNARLQLMACWKAHNQLSIGVNWTFFAIYTVSQITTLMLHINFNAHQPILVIFSTMLLKQYAIKRWFVFPPLLIIVSALPGKHEPGNCVFSVMLCTVSRKRHCFGLLYLRHASTNFNNIL